ncbi:four-carbon acid sugar kinase family protein [Promicromonospora panici]|uniref:four-carbon acid sugar kinase family protein n=1 Tax=Promicromonospora panici TaxID=2219658 RepID=UPI00101B972F|nr:four-carbon acid sugar kinase family protein [Promicromonospora panici]
MSQDTSQSTVGVVADDLTGAGDCVVQFARAGWTSHLALGSALPVGERTAVAVVTDARPLDDAAARAATADAVRALVSAGTRRLYVKIDSTMRGSVAGQVAGALAAWRERVPGAFAVVCPSYPALRRTVSGGVLLVDGAPVATTTAGHDPVTPVRDSDLTALLPSAVRVPADDDARTLALRLAAAGSSAGTVVVDAVDDADLERLADAVALLGADAVPVGSAGLAAALAPRWGGAAAVPEPPRVAVERALVVLSSLNEVSLEQADELVRAEPGTHVLVPDPAVGADQVVASWLAGLGPGASPRTVLVRTPEPTETGRERAVQVASSLAGLVAAIAGRTRPDAIVLIGGDGSRAVLARLGARSVRVAGSVAEGVPLGHLEGGSAAGTVVVTKAGGFGTARTVVDVLTNLRSYCSHQEVTP